VSHTVHRLLDKLELSQGESFNIERPVLVADQDNLLSRSNRVQPHIPNPDLDHAHERGWVSLHRGGRSDLELLLLSPEDVKAAFARVIGKDWQIEAEKVVRGWRSEEQRGVLDRRYAIWLAADLLDERAVGLNQEVEYILEAGRRGEARARISSRD
jgi:hypothetical protein